MRIAPVGETTSASFDSALARVTVPLSSGFDDVDAVGNRTGRPHGTIHNELRRACGGPPTAVCSVEQLEQRIATLQSW